MRTRSHIFTAHVFGPFCPATMGNPATYYQTAEHKAAHIARRYVAFRARGYGATEARRRALALPPVYLPGYSDGYGTCASLGRPWESSGTTLQWAERPAALGFRFVAWADEIKGSRVDHFGWYNREGEHESLRGGVWRLPHGRLVPGFAEMEGRREMNPGSAALALGDMIRETGGAEADDSALIEAARTADGIAEAAAEAQREEDCAYQAGARAAREIAEAEEARREALALLGEMRAAGRKSWDRAGAICKALQAALEDKLEAIREARDKRADAWGDCPAWLESAWRDGYAEEAGRDGWNQFARGLRLSRFAEEAGAGLIERAGA